MKPEQQLAYLADRLRDISAFGLHYTENPYDRARYQAVQDVAVELLAFATQEPVESFEPLRAPVLARPTPYVGGDAAIFNDAGQLLLVQRADNGLWALPGGALEVGETPAAGVEREAFEETGVRCRAVRLAGIFDSRLAHSVTRHHLYHVLFVCWPLATEALGQGSHKQEVRQVAWFAADALPADMDPGHASFVPVAVAVWRGERGPHFDATLD
jgi:ADP-ribose pyrophosphatase YjhB (NUDIX family)